MKRAELKSRRVILSFRLKDTFITSFNPILCKQKKFVYGLTLSITRALTFTFITRLARFLFIPRFVLTSHFSDRKSKQNITPKSSQIYIRKLTRDFIKPLASLFYCNIYTGCPKKCIHILNTGKINDYYNCVIF